MSYWLFQGNPNYYRLIEGIRSHERLSWSISHYSSDRMTIGEGVLIWLSSPNPGIYAIARIVETIGNQKGVWSIEDDKSERVFERPHVFLQITRKLLEQPLLQEDLQKDLFLKDLSILDRPDDREYKVRPQEWQRVFELI